ncbi:cysteine desulfurase family protein [Rhizobium leguminosarum]|uniref:cysteine desulfurase family protein n=1 Tax=Rhizobium leguminosarum TaxID=384 RepID=UPI00140FBFB8|nr:cysteine desulfurase family protein [Rhizobium leguminosarum]QIO61587.1 cysteine desulfurase [Rhizobium leguminosarum bv. trifolii]
MNSRGFSRAIDSSLGTFETIYLDHHATTPVDSRVAKIVFDMMVSSFGNANSVDHVFGETAASIVTDAKGRVAALVGSDPDNVFFTSGSTEAIRLAISHAIGPVHASPLRIALTRVEHQALIDTAQLAERLGIAVITWIDVDHRARLISESLHAALESGTDLVCVMAANNEVGTIYPLGEIVPLVHRHDAAILVDATQAAGRIPFDGFGADVDYLILSGHKIYGPKGVGALVSGAYEASRVYGLGATHDATPNVPGIAGMGEACRIMLSEGEVETRRIVAMRDRLQKDLVRLIPNLVVNGDQENRLAHNLHISVPDTPNDLIVSRLRKKVAISTGAACMSGAQSSSHVLRAMGMDDGLQEGALRIGLGRFTSESDIENAAAEIAAAVRDVRNAMAGQDYE